MTAAHMFHCLVGILRRELLRFLHQRARFISALVRPLVWLLIFAAGFRAIGGLAVGPPYGAEVSYEVYIVPGLVVMVQLFNGMQSSLSMVYDREMGSMRTLLVSPLPRWYLLSCKLMAGTFVSLLQVYAFLVIASLVGVQLPATGYRVIFRVVWITGLMLGALGLLLSSVVRQLENFAGVMNFVIFPMFFLSPALYPLERTREGSEFLYWAALLNPFTHAVEFARFALHGQLQEVAAAATLFSLFLFLTLAVWVFDPARSVTGPRKGGGR